MIEYLEPRMTSTDPRRSVRRGTAKGSWLTGSRVARPLRSLGFLLAFGMTLASAVGADRNRGFQVLTGRPFDAAMPKDFYLEGNTIPTEKRNAALLRTPAGKRLLVALIDTSGYSSQAQEKYIGMLITEGPISVCGHAVGVGSYGFGLVKTAPDSKDRGDRFFLYDQAGKPVLGCLTRRDAEIEHPRPLQVLVQGRGSARLYLGRDWLIISIPRAAGALSCGCQHE